MTFTLIESDVVFGESPIADGWVASSRRRLCTGGGMRKR